MDIQAYITSGILELYLADALSNAERREVEFMAVRHPEVKTALQEVEHTLAGYSSLHALEPRHNLKKSIISKIRREGDEKPRRAGLYGLVSLIVAILAIALAVLYYMQNREVVEANDQLVFENNSLRASVNELQQQIRLVSDPATRAVTLQGTESHPDAKVLVFWNADRNGTIVAMQNLPAPRAGKQYQLWSMLDGQPTSAGVLDWELDEMQAGDAVKEADAFAITLEDMGGAEQPDMRQLYVIGRL